MNNYIKKGILILTATFASLITAFSSGCASGGFKLTRQYAGFVNKQNILLRIIIYIFTGIIYAITMLIDLVLFNTMDFWEGKVSQGTYEFEKDGKSYIVNHQINNGLKSSQIDIFENGNKTHQFKIMETAKGEIQLFENGSLKATVDQLNMLPRVTMLNKMGLIENQTYILNQFEITKK